MASGKTSCCFCDSLVPGLSKAQWDTILHDSGNFLVVPTKGALVPGWLLVVAKRHVLCAGAAAESELEELTDCLSIAQRMVRKGFGEPTVFEHGPSASGTSLGCGIDHLHIHVAALPFSLREATTRQFPQVYWKPITGISATTSLFAAQMGYGLVREPGGCMSVCTPPDYIRQLFRRVIA